MMNDLEIPKWKKRKPSSTSNASAKAKHKHQYIDAVIFEEGNDRPNPGKVCKICGKVGAYQVFDTVKEGIGVRMMTTEEMAKKYKRWPRYSVPDLLASDLHATKIEK